MLSRITSLLRLRLFINACPSQSRSSFAHFAVVAKDGRFQPILRRYLKLTWARFLCVARSKLRLCSANHRSGYFSNLAFDWLSIVWAYSKRQKTVPVISTVIDCVCTQWLAHSWYCIMNISHEYGISLPQNSIYSVYKIRVLSKPRWIQETYVIFCELVIPMIW